MSEASSAAAAFVSTHLEAAAALGAELSELIDQPDQYLAVLTAGIERLTDPAYLAMITRACPETPARFAIRRPLSEALMKPVTQALLEGSSMSALQLAQGLVRAPHRDLRLYANVPLGRALPEDPEMSWQLLRRLGRAARDWIATDSLADLWARGVLAEDFRWAELEQLLYSEQTYERRLVMATLATIPHRVPRAGHDGLRPVALPRALAIIRQLMGDAEVMVQKGLSWAIREWTPIGPDETATLLVSETDIAAREHDGARAWVIRDALGKQPQALADELRDRLAGLRRDPAAPSTSPASTRAAAFAAALRTSPEVAAAQGDRYMRSRA